MSVTAWKLDIAPAGADRPATLRAELDPDLDQLSELTEQIQEFVSRVDPAEAHRVVLSVDEILTNVIQYGLLRKKPGTIRVRIRLLADRIHVRIDHEGVSFNPFVEAPTPDIDLPLEERPIGGLGVFLVKSLMTSTRYERVGDCNRITLTRSLDPPRPANPQAGSPRRETP